MQGYPRGLPVDKATGIHPSPEASCPQVRSTRWVTYVHLALLIQRGALPDLHANPGTTARIYDRTKVVKRNSL